MSRYNFLTNVFAVSKYLYMYEVCILLFLIYYLYPIVKFLSEFESFQMFYLFMFSLTFEVFRLVFGGRIYF